MFDFSICNLQSAIGEVPCTTRPRVFEVELLQAHGRSAAGPGRAAEVNIRTVRHYIHADLGSRLRPSAGIGGRASLPPLMFTEDEALALTLGLSPHGALGRPRQRRRSRARWPRSSADLRCSAAICPAGQRHVADV
jgi:hypothetical protein